MNAMISTASITTLADIPPMPPMPQPSRSHLGFKSINIPPPCPMQWQLSIDESQCDLPSIDTSAFHMRPSLTPQIEVINRHPFTPTLLSMNKESLSVLHQFGEHNEYGSCYNTIVDGFVRQQQDGMQSIVPAEINKICAAFFYEEQNEYTQIAYKLFKLMRNSTDHKNCTNGINGKILVEMMEKHLSDEVSRQNIDQLCNNLLKFGLLEVVSYETSFFSLFDNKEASDKKLFNKSEHYIYQLTVDNVKAFENFMDDAKE